MFVTYINNKTVVNTDLRMTREEILMAALYPQEMAEKAKHTKNFFETRTFDVTVSKVPPRIEAIINNNLVPLLMRPVTKEYLHFRIPKASGGTRHIEAPGPELKRHQREVADILLHRLLILPHTASYAYTRGRCAYDALVTHQRNNARWFLKLDIKDFFPSITRDVLMDKLSQIVPLDTLSHLDKERLINIATNEDGVLPQGSPLSPMLSNLVMLAFDYRLTHKLWNFNKQHFTYTRYADDMLISSAYDFKFQDIITVIEELFECLDLPFKLNKSKVRYGSKAGRNWNLGLMYNQDQQITIGTKKKKILHSLLNSFVVDYLHGEPWSKEETQELVGKLAYLKNIEPTYYDTLITKYETKYNAYVRDLFRSVLNETV